MRARAKIAASAITLVATAMVLVPAVAGASNALISGSSMIFFASVGETNEVTAEFDGTDFVITDPGAAITPMAGCVAVNANQVKCTSGGISVVSLRLGDLNDRAAIGSTVADSPDIERTEVEGDAGDDIIFGGQNLENQLDGGDPFFDSPGADTLVGGNENDQLYGGGGTDILRGVDGSDYLVGGDGDDDIDGGNGNDAVEEGSQANGADLLVAGPGQDQLQYGAREAPVLLSENGLADDGAAGEGDNLGGDFEFLTTGDGDDTISGSPRGASYNSGDGNDAVSAGGGNDVVYGGYGNDVIAGEAGSDSLEGGPGDDSVSGGDGNDFITDGNDQAGSGSDQFLGGPGIDRLTYFTTEPLTIDLDGVADDGAAGENDNAGSDLEDWSVGRRPTPSPETTPPTRSKAVPETTRSTASADPTPSSEAPATTTSTAAQASTPSTVPAAVTRSGAATSIQTKSAAAPRTTPCWPTASTTSP
ncbi:MAG: hypothetical protein IPK93_07105 [Solirubrobacterales bacterium]|nr:hypothetical protein [Solirubrobacterales bacterium]